MRKQSGFTLIELVIVVIILGLLAATALPRFLDVTEDAEDVAIEGTAGGFASAVGLVRAQWEVNGRPQGTGNDVVVDYDNVDMGVDPTTGYPSRRPAAADTLAANMDVDDCVYLIDNLFQAGYSASSDFTDKTRVYVRLDSARICHYHQKTGLAAAPTNTTGNNSFSYNAATGRVAVNLNKP